MFPSRPEMSDAESLLQEEQKCEEEATPRRSLRGLLGLGAAVLAVGALCLATRRGDAELTAEASDVVGLFAVPDGCFKKGMFYVHPVTLPGTEKTSEFSAEDCQARCKNADGCKHFTYWPDGGCLLTGEGSYLKAAGTTYSDAIVGPKDCDDLSAYEADGAPSSEFCEDGTIGEGPSAGSIACQLRCDGNPMCEYYSLWSTGGENWCRLTSTCDVKQEQSGHTISIYKKMHTTTTTSGPPTTAAVVPPASVSVSPAPAPPGVNGTSCSAYPACLAVGISEGTCCPNADGVALGCCNGFPPAPVVANKPVPQPGPVGPASCTLAPNCAALGLEGNCCPNDENNRLGCCPGGAPEAAANPEPDVAADSKQRCENNALCKENSLMGLCCPNPANVSLGCCDSMVDQTLGAAGPVPEFKPPAASPGPLMTFYLYRVDNDQKYALNGVNMANLDGDTWYLHNEVVISCPRKFGITRLTRFKITMRATRELYGQDKKFDSFVAFDKAKCTVPGCAQLHWDPLGYVIGCSPNDKGRVALPGQPAWFSLPGTCPSKFYFQKTAECVAAEPGGNCNGAAVTGSRTCTYNIEEAGEISLDELSGIKNYNEVCQSEGKKEYDELTDKGVGSDFWDGKEDPEKGAARIQRIKELFAEKFPQWPAHLEDPPCEV